MGRLLPAGLAEPSAPEAEPRVIGIDGEEADDLLAAMASRKARELLAALHEEPAAPSDLADQVSTSLQNVQYHLEKLQDAGAVEVVDTVYSEKGREMKLYAPTDRPLVVVAADADETASLRSAIGSLLTGLAVIGLVAVLVQFLAEDRGTQSTDDVAIMSAETTTPTPGFVPMDLLAEPGVLVFVGGVAALLVVGAVWYVRR